MIMINTIMHNTFQTRTGRAASLLALLVLASGCGHRISTPDVPARHLYVGLDTSVSFRRYLGQSVTLCSRQGLMLNPDCDKMTVYRMDSNMREFYDNAAPESGSRFQRSLITEAAAESAARGTFPSLFWKAVAARIPADSGSVTIEIFSDGDNDDETAQSRAEITAAAQQLSANPHVVSVSIFGADPRNWAVLRGEFAALGDRFHLCSPPEMTADRMATALDGN